MFISLDGVDGAGKSTQFTRLSGWLREQGHDVAECRDPGTTALGNAIRELILHRHEMKMDLRAEMFLYMAARAQLVDEFIRPALADGRTVLSDRYLLANIVYQGYAGGLEIDQLRKIGRIATQRLKPDLTVVLDLAPDAAAERRNTDNSRTDDRIEQRGIDFQAAVRQGFLTEAARRPKRIVIVDAARDVDTVHADICQAVERVIASSRQ